MLPGAMRTTSLPLPGRKPPMNVNLCPAAAHLPHAAHIQTIIDRPCKLPPRLDRCSRRQNRHHARARTSCGGRSRHDPDCARPSRNRMELGCSRVGGHVTAPPSFARASMMGEAFRPFRIRPRELTGGRRRRIHGGPAQEHDDALRCPGVAFLPDGRQHAGRRGNRCFLRPPRTIYRCLAAGWLWTEGGTARSVRDCPIP